MTLQCVAQGEQLVTGFHRLKPLGSLHHACGGPPQGHAGISPAFDVVADAPDGPVHILNNVGAGQGAAQLDGQAQAADGEDLVQPF